MPNSYVMLGRSQHYPDDLLEWVVAEAPDWDGNFAPEDLVPGSIVCQNVVTSVAEPGPNANGDDFSGVLGDSHVFNREVAPQVRVMYDQHPPIIGVDPAIGEDVTVGVAFLQHHIPDPPTCWERIMGDDLF